MSHRVHAGRISNLAVLILALGGGGVLAAAPAADDRLIVRVAVADLPANLLERVDTCAIERTASGRGAVLLLSPQEAAGLDVPHEVLGTLADHYRRFMPVNTIRRKAVPSLERYAQEVAPARRAAGEDPCAGIGVTLAPYDEYHNLAEGMCFLEKLADAYPQITDLRTIGASLEDRPIRALRITDQPGAVEASEQRILFTGVTHAREWATHEVMLYIAEQLTSGYGRDPRITSIVDHCEIWLVPVVNPDGYVYSWDEDPMWRKNRRELGTCDGVDINRNYDFNWGPHPGSSGNTCSEIYRGSAPASEPETQVIQNLLAQNDFAVGVSFHSYAQLVLFAWGHTTEVKPESYSTLRALARGYSTRVLDSHGELYIPGQSSYTIYLTNGDFDDYAYGAHGVLSFTPEVRPDSFAEGGFMLPEDQILEACEENMAGALWLMEVVAGASEVQRAGGGPLLADMPGNGGGFSLPVSPANQKPDAALAFPAAPSGALSTWLDDTEHDPPFEGTWGADFEGVGAGSAYRADVGIDAVSAWAQELQSYVGLPGVFADGAEVMLSNVEPGLNWIGLPGAAPLRLAEVQVIKRRLASTGQEEVLEQRGALQDAAAPAPWLNWTWTTRDSQGRVEHAHPTGDGGASAYILPYRLYEVQVHVPSATFDSTILPVYLLRFPPADPDCDDNGLDDAEELAAGLAADCNRNEVVDACEIEAGAAQDCNGNGVPDGCELSTAYEALSPLLGPLDSGSPLSFMLADPPVAAAAVSIEVQARGDLGGTSEYLDIDINGLHAGRVFEAGGQDCPAKPETALFAVGGDAYNAALAGGDALFEIMPSSEVDDGQCKGSEVRLKISYARPDPDCNGNQVLDTCDLAGGISADCNADHIPDDCQLHADFQAGSPQFSPLAAGVSHEWLVDPAPPAAGSVGLSLSAVGDLGAAGEHVEIYINDQLAARAFDHEASDCPPSPDVHSLALPASLYNALLVDGRALIRLQPTSAVSGTQCAGGSWIQMELAYALPPGDCDGNGHLDSCDLQGGASDCDADGRPDVCQMATSYSAASPPLAPLAAGLTHAYTVASAPPAAGDVSLSIGASGDIGGASEWLTVRLDGELLGDVFQSGGEDCTPQLLQAGLTVPAALFNAAAADEEVVIAVTPSAGVDGAFCSSSQLVVELSYAISPPDCDGDGLLDSCAIAGGAADCNHNETIDACEITAQPPLDCDGDAVLDSCELQSNPKLDCDADAVLDSCELKSNPKLDCNGNSSLDICDLASGASHDHNGNGVPDECDDLPVLMGSDPPDGAVDARQPIHPQTAAPVGWDRVELIFQKDAAGLAADDFIVESTGPAPAVQAVEVDGPVVTVIFDGPLQPGTCSALVYLLGDQRVRLGYLPGDVNGDGVSGPLDILALIDDLNDSGQERLPPWQCDANRSGFCEPLDILRVIDLLNGAGSFAAWNGQALPTCP